MKDLVLENTDVNKFYKSYILKKNMISFNYRDDQVFIQINSIVIIL